MIFASFFFIVCICVALQGKVDFKDWETYEGLFMEYWALINEKEGLTVKHLQSAKVRLKTGNNYKSDSDSNEPDLSEEDQLISDSDIMDYIEEQKPERKRKKEVLWAVISREKKV